MLTRDEIETKLKANPDWEPDSASPSEVWDLYYEILDSLDFDDNEDVGNGLEESEDGEEKVEGGGEDIDDDWEDDTF